LGGSRLAGQAESQPGRAATIAAAVASLAGRSRLVDRAGLRAGIVTAVRRGSGAVRRTARARRSGMAASLRLARRRVERDPLGPSRAERSSAGRSSEQSRGSRAERTSLRAALAAGRRGRLATSLRGRLVTSRRGRLGQSRRERMAPGRQGSLGASRGRSLVAGRAVSLVAGRDRSLVASRAGSSGRSRAVSVRVASAVHSLVRENPRSPRSSRER
jgi:hypothetical protein